MSQETLLGNYRALDLTDEKGFLCGKIVADLGADVIKIERPGGDPSRNIGPFYKDIPAPEKSLYWFAYNANKRGITLDITTAVGQDLFKRLVARADFIIESFPLGYMDRLGLGYSELSKINPRIVITSITPFGQSGPYKEYQVSDIVATAMSGMMSISGDPDRPPVRISLAQAYLHAGADAAAGTMLAHYYRERTGEGQMVDVSIVASLVRLLMQFRPLWEFNRRLIHREGQFRWEISTGNVQRMLWPCKDGFVYFIVMGGGGNAPRSNRALVDWMEGDGMDVKVLKGVDWESTDIKSLGQQAFKEFEKVIGEFFMKYTRTELYQSALKRRIFLYPVSTVEDIVNDPQLSARGFWETVQHPELGSNITYPGAFAKLSETTIHFRHRAPLVGEHNQEVYVQELGLSQREINLLAESGII